MSLAEGSAFLKNAGAFGPVVGRSPFGFSSPYGPSSSSGSWSGSWRKKGPVNPAHINSAKGALDGGVGWKNILQDCLASKKLFRQVTKEDIVYTCVKAGGGRSCTLTIPALGAGHVYISDQSGRDEKQAGAIAAAKALKALFPDVYEAALEMHANKEGTQGSTANASGEIVDAKEEPKSLLNRLVQLTIRKQIQKGDISYDTQWKWSLNGYVSTLRISCMHGGVERHTYVSEGTNHVDSRMAEKEAAQKALDVNKALFSNSQVAHERKKILDAAKGPRDYRTGNFNNRPNTPRDDTRSTQPSLAAPSSALSDTAALSALASYQALLGIQQAQATRSQQLSQYPFQL